MATIKELLDKRKKEHRESEGPLFSFEYYPPRTKEGVAGLYKRLWRMRHQNPLFSDVTWGAGGTTSDLTMQICLNAMRFGHQMNMHLTCTNMPAELAYEVCSHPFRPLPFTLPLVLYVFCISTSHSLMFPYFHRLWKSARKMGLSIFWHCEATPLLELTNGSQQKAGLIVHLTW